MTVTSADVHADPLEAANAFAVDDVVGGRSTEAFVQTEIANGDFKAALERSLKQARLLAESNAPRFRTRATLIALRRPTSGFDTNVRLEVRYEVTDVRTGERVLDEVIATQHSADVGDAIIGEERMRIATEGSARENIAAFIAKARALR